jgi:hypothetical protein
MFTNQARSFIQYTLALAAKATRHKKNEEEK